MFACEIIYKFHTVITVMVYALSIYLVLPIVSAIIIIILLATSMYVYM